MTDELGDRYEKAVGSLRRAEARLRSILAEIVTSIEDRKLVRAELTGVRVKTLDSIRRKATAHHWPATTAINRCADLVGTRVVCNNVRAPDHRYDRAVPSSYRLVPTKDSRAIPASASEDRSQYARTTAVSGVR